MNMNYLLLTFLVIASLSQINGQSEDGNIIKEDGKVVNGRNEAEGGKAVIRDYGLDPHGFQVCNYTDQVTRLVNVSFQQQTTKIIHKKTCTWRGCKIVSRIIVVTVLRYQQRTQMVDRYNYYCCNGWMRHNENETSCKIPICGVSCRNGGTCVAPDTCKCLAGYEGKYCQLVIDDCAVKERNDCEQVCVPMKPGHRCSCKHGYKLKMDNKHCRDIDECKRDNPPCKCAKQDGVCKAKCTNLPGEYKCSCNKGYIVTSAEECEDINECFVDPKLCDQKCVNKPGTYECTCFPGFEYNKALKKCIDINECLHDNGGCSDVCHNIDGSFVCTCKEGFYLGNDSKTCERIRPTMKHKRFCQTDSFGELDCADKFIIIMTAMYGRLTTEYCQYGNFTDVRCEAKDPAKYLHTACDNQNYCIFFLEKGVFGDPCPGTEKYMEVTYDCLK